VRCTRNRDSGQRVQVNKNANPLVVLKTTYLLLWWTTAPVASCTVPETVMLSPVTESFRVKAALVLAALYAFCVLAPSAVFAFADGAAIAWCLTEDHGVAPMHHDAGTVHVHADGTSHHHPDSHASHSDSGDHAKGHAGDCCGLFPMAGLSGEPRIAFGPSNLTAISFPVLTDALHGRGPERINRPPIA
jgi:hypothetical protein